MDNSSKYKSEDGFRQIVCLHIRYVLRVLHDECFGVKPSGSLARDQKQYSSTRSVADKQMAKKSIRHGGERTAFQNWSELQFQEKNSS